MAIRRPGAAQDRIDRPDHQPATAREAGLSARRGDREPRHRRARRRPGRKRGQRRVGQLERPRSVSSETWDSAVATRGRSPSSPTTDTRTSSRGVPCGHRVIVPRRRRDRRHARGRAPRACRQEPMVLANAMRSCPPAAPPSRWSTPGSDRRRRAVAGAAPARAAFWSGRTTGFSPARSTASVGRLTPWSSHGRPSGSSPCQRPSTAATCSRRWRTSIPRRPARRGRRGDRSELPDHPRPADPADLGGRGRRPRHPPGRLRQRDPRPRRFDARRWADSAR